MAENNNEGKKENKFTNFIKDWYFLLLLGIAVFVSYKIVTYYLSRFDECLIFGDPNTFGVFGDFIGGILNPTLAFLSFIALLITIRIQSKELKNSTEELAKSSKALSDQSKSLQLQNFETTFFNMLNLHKQTLLNIEVKPEIIDIEIRNSKEIYKFQYEEELKGRHVINYLYSHFIHFRDEYNHYYVEKKSSVIFEDFIQKFIYDIGPYFMNIYQILKFIDNSNNIENKKFYSNILRAQLSTSEFALLFLNSLGNNGNEKFLPLLIKYEFFEQLPCRVIKLFLQDDLLMCVNQTKKLCDDYPYNKLFGKNKDWEIFIKEIMQLEHLIDNLNELTS